MRRLQRRQEGQARPIRVLQVGQGNFLRAFFDQMLDIANESGETNAGVAIVKPTNRGDLAEFQAQNCLFTVVLRGKEGGKARQRGRVVRCVQRAVNPYEDYEGFLALAEEPLLRFVVSNTTEAGLALAAGDGPAARPCPSFPGKLAQFLHARWRHFGGDPAKGVVLLPTELVDDNGARLRALTLQAAENLGLEPGFAEWLENACEFCDTLVDRIVSGYPRDGEELCRQLGYEDRLLTVAEPYALWVIQCKEPEALERELPLDRAGLPVLFTRDLRSYRLRKLRLLNGGHTGAMPLAYLLGYGLVRQAMGDGGLRAHLRAMLEEEVLPTVPLPEADLRAFLQEVLERFDNPYLDHQILSIALNSTAKWRARILPSLLDRAGQTGELPARLSFSLAALLALYLRWPEGLRDTEEAEAFFDAHRRGPRGEAFVKAYLQAFAPEALGLDGLAALVAADLEAIERHGPRAAMEALAARRDGAN